MWIVNHHWQDDDYKGISSGLHDQWVFEAHEDAETKAFEVRQTLALNRFDDSDPDVADPFAVGDDAAMRLLQEKLYQGEYIPGPTEWVTVRQPSS